MTALDCYLLVSLLFIIGTTVEFAFVLVVKEIFEPFKIKRKAALREKTMETNTQQDGNGITVGICRVEPIENLEPESKVLRQNELGIIRNETGLLRFLMDMSLTKRIDLTAFFVFNISYFIFNCVYWIYFK
jgi:hypothetical protein